MTVCERQLDLLNVAFEARLREATRLRVPHDQLLEFWCDLSQSVARKPWGAKLRPFRPRAQIFSYAAGRCVDGMDLMRMLGWPRSMLAGISAGDLLHLASDGSFLPMVTLIQCLLWSNPHGTWHGA